MYTQIVDYLAARVSSIVTPKTTLLGARAANFLPKDCPVLEVYQEKPAAVVRLTTDGTAEIRDMIRVGYYVTDPDRLVSGGLNEVGVRAASTAIDALVPKLLGLFAPDPTELPGVELTLTQISRRIRSGGNFGIEMTVSATYILAPEVTP